jgi:phospholipid/cholesterol/gamma-HCH transport system ATP-binding protein
MFLYDEATTGLDPVNADIICKLILDLTRGGKGFIIVTHKVFDALRLAERFMFLKNGSIIFDGNKDQLMQSSVPEIQVFLKELKLPLATLSRQGEG